MNKKLTVKKEHDISSVKNENGLDEAPFVSNEVQILNSGSLMDQLKQEKEDVLQELITIKSENQKLNFEVQRKGDELQTLTEKYSFETMKLSKTIESLKNEMAEWKQRYSVECESNKEQEKTILNLKREKNELSAQLVQLRKTTSISNQEVEDEVYEVDKLLDHKINRVRHFLVRWKNFTSEHDSWVTEDDLHCKTILNEYLKKKNLKKYSSH